MIEEPRGIGFSMEQFWERRYGLYLSATLFLLSFLFLWQEITGFMPFFLAALLLGAGIEDWSTGYISDGWSLLILAEGILFSLFEGNGTESALSFLVTAFLYGILYKAAPHSMGTGDIGLALGVSVWLMPWEAPLFIWLSAVLALLYLAIRFLILQKTGNDVRFAPFIGMGGMILWTGRFYGLWEGDLLSFLLNL